MSNFTPDLHPPKELGAFRFWCQKVLPLTYDDSLSYYELLSKVVKILNDVISNQQTEGEDIAALHTAFGQLEGYVNNYFNALDVTDEINAKLDNLVETGVMGEIVEPVVQIYYESYIASTNNRINELNTEIGRQNLRTSTIEDDMSEMHEMFNSAVHAITTDTEVTDIRTGTVGALGTGSVWNANAYPTAGDAVRLQLNDMIWAVSKTKIDGTTDLNDIVTVGNYYINSNEDAANITHFPPVAEGADKACMIKVLTYRPPTRTTPSGYGENYTYPMQILIAWDGSYGFIRTKETNSTWGSWKNMGINVDISVSALENRVEALEDAIVYHLTGAIHIGRDDYSSVDLNTFKTYGQYYTTTVADTANVSNSPTQIPYTLTIENALGGLQSSTYPRQIIKEWTGATQYERCLLNATNNTWSEWRKIYNGLPEEQKTGDIITPNIVSGVNYHKYLYKGIESPGYEIGIISDVHKLLQDDTRNELNLLLDYYIENPNVKMILNLGDTTQSIGSDVDDAYLKKIYKKILDSGKGYACVLGNHDVRSIDGTTAINTYLNGSSNYILLNQPTGMGYVVNVSGGNLVYCDASNVSSISMKPDRVYMLEQEIEGETVYQPIYLGCCYSIKPSTVTSREVSSNPAMHTMGNSIELFSKVCNFLSGKKHAPWIFAAHESYTLSGNWQKVSEEKGIYYKDDANGVENRPSNYYVTPFSAGGFNDEPYLVNSTKYSNYGRLLALMEKGTSGTSLSFTMPGNTYVSGETFNFTVEPYTALNDVGLILTGHWHTDLNFSKLRGYDSDVSEVRQTLFSCNCNTTRYNYSDVIYDTDSNYFNQCFTTIALCARDSTADDITYIIQRFGAQNTSAGIIRDKMIYTREV